MPMPQHRIGWRSGATCVITLFALGGCATATLPPDDEGAAATTTAAQQQAAAPTGGAGGCTMAQYGGAKIDLKGAKVGFSQSEPETAAFRIAETQSIKDEAAKEGIAGLVSTNAAGDLTKQLADVQGLIAAGVKLLVIAPLKSDGWGPVFQQASAAHIPIITIDRKINATVCKDYLTFIGSNFTDQGKRAADAMAKAMNNQGKLVILLGSAGNNVTDERTKGFTDELTKVAPGIQVVAQQTAEFNRVKGKEVAATLLQAHPDITGLYGENDEMAIGAEAAMKATGKKPGDIKIVSIDGTRGAVQGIVDGWFSAVIESNPRFGPLAFQTAQQFFNGQGIADKVTITDRAYDTSSAQDGLSYAF